MTGLNGQRVYLDWNATAPLRPEARAAMLEAMDVVGNPSSVHAEGRAAKAIVEKARGQVAALVGCEPDEVVFTSGATEANNIVLGGAIDMYISDGQHESVYASLGEGGNIVVIPLTSEGLLASVALEPAPTPTNPYFTGFTIRENHCEGSLALSPANAETGVMTDVQQYAEEAHRLRMLCHCDATQAIGKVPYRALAEGVTTASISGHKFGAPKGAGALISRAHGDHLPQLPDYEGSLGGGQEKGRRSGTENVIGIAGFGAAAAAAQRDLEAGVWEPIENLRNLLEESLAAAAPDTIFFGQEAPRLPNTSCFAVPGWAGETQVMQMDLAGFAISAGSACSSGKVKKASRVLLAMGFDEVTASSAIRVSMGPTTTEAEVMAFADAWKEAYRRRKARAA